MEKNIIVAIDVDGVLRNNLSIMLELYNNEFKDNKLLEDITDFKTDISFPRIRKETGIKASDWFFNIHSKEIFEDAKPYPHVIEDIKIINDFAKIIICTYQKTSENKIQTLRWLENNKVEYDDICFLKDKTLITSDYFIDDNDWNFIGCKSKNGLLVNAPYNIRTDINQLLQQTSCKTLKRVDSFH